MILFELLFALMLAGTVLLVFPLLVLAASVAGIMLLWVLAPTVLSRCPKALNSPSVSS